MARLPGNIGKLSIGGTDVKDFVTQIDINNEFDEWETTSVADSTKNFAKLLQEGEINLTFQQDDDSDFRTVFVTYANGSDARAVDIEWDDASGNVEMRLRGTCHLFGTTFSNQQNKEATGTMKLKLSSGVWNHAV